MIKYLKRMNPKRLIDEYLKNTVLSNYTSIVSSFYADEIKYRITYKNKYGMNVYKVYSFEDFSVKSLDDKTKNYSIDKRWVTYVYNNLKIYQPELVNDYVRDFYKYRQIIKKEMVEEFDEKTNSFIEDDLNFFDLQS